MVFVDPLAISLYASIVANRSLALLLPITDQTIVQTLRSGQYLIGGHEDVVLEMIEAANIGAADSSEYLERYSRYAGLIDHHLRAIIKGGFFAMSGTGRIVGK